MKVVINTCYGGFSLSAKAVKRMAEIQGRPCYFFKSNLRGPYEPLKEAEADNEFIWVAFDIPNPNKVLKKQDNWSEMSQEERQASNALYKKHDLTNRPQDRADKVLVSVVEELGDKANGRCADLKVVEIPDGVEYEIDEYDGLEHVAEKHRTWA